MPIVDSEEYFLAHYGTPRRSGRYPWGSGGREGAENRRNRSFLDMVETMKKDGLTEPQIAKGMGITVQELRDGKSIALNQQKQERILEAQRLGDKGLSNVAIGAKMGLNESSVRALRAPGELDKTKVLDSTVDMLKRQVDSKEFVDVGSNVYRNISLSDNPSAAIGISQTKFNAALTKLKSDGYNVHTLKLPQAGTGEMTTYKVLVKPGVTQKDAWTNRHNIRQIQESTKDNGRTFLGIHPPLSIKANRVAIRYAEDGGAHADGMLFVRPGVKDVSIGNSHYAQVRVAVNGTHFLKGMAVYKDDLPAGVDIVFNTNKSNTGNKFDAMKKLKDDPDNPFGAVLKMGGQIVNSKGKVTSSMNILNEEGDWEGWSRKLSSQILSKQSPSLAKQQLKMTFEKKAHELEEIMALTNPTVRRDLLMKFADSADSSAVHLKAATLPNSAHHVILPVSSMKSGEIYAPNFRDGERVALIRSPHGGTFEIPELTVNNKNREARKLLGSSTRDAVGIHHSVAQRLSGADFDGDTVIVIPNNKGQIKHTPALEGLKNFDPQHSFPPHHGMRTIDGGIYNAHTREVDYGKDAQGNPHKPKATNKHHEMGKITNLIADMSIKGASNEEKARAIRHSMVVIDAEKHNLNYKESFRANNIGGLKEKYQGSPQGGAKTLISRAKSKTFIDARKGRPAAEGGPIDKATGERVYVPSGATKRDRHGNLIPKQTEHKLLSITKDAHSLSSGTQIEGIYADHSNRLKAMANAARKEAVNTKSIPYSSSAKTVYHKEVSSLESKLNIALKNAPLERQAQVIAGRTIAQKRQANPGMDKADVKKIKNQALAEARSRTGAGKDRIKPTQLEWDAIQAGAISNHKLEQILAHADAETIKTLAMPKVKIKMTPTKQARAQTMLAAGFTQAEVAQALGVSLSTLKVSISE
jgi:DNA-binding NarL/FixJ family response regulator